MTETTGTAKNQNDAVSRVTKNETNASNENIVSIIIDRIGPLFACLYFIVNKPILPFRLVNGKASFHLHIRSRVSGSYSL